MDNTISLIEFLLEKNKKYNKPGNSQQNEDIENKSNYDNITTNWS